MSPRCKSITPENASGLIPSIAINRRRVSNWRALPFLPGYGAAWWQYQLPGGFRAPLSPVRLSGRLQVGNDFFNLTGTVTPPG